MTTAPGPRRYVTFTVQSARGRRRARIRQVILTAFIFFGGIAVATTDFDGDGKPFSCHLSPGC